MKILHLANFYHRKSGGIRTYLDAKRRYFAERGLPFRLVVPDERDGIERAEPDSVVYRIASPRAPLNPLYRIIVNLGVVHQIVKREEPDLLEVNDKFTLMALSYFYRKVQKRLPTAGFHHERLDVNMGIYFGERPLLRRLVGLYMQIFSAAFDRVVCASRFTAAEIEPIAADKVELLNLGIDLGRFDPALADEAVRRRFAAGAELLLLYVGRIAREKNVALLPPVMARLAEQGVRARLVVAGVGDEEKTLREAGAAGIDLVGHIGDRELLARLYASADVFVFPSVIEPYGLVPLEALASGLPVVCPDSGGVLEYRDSEAVRSVPPEPGEFAAAILELAAGDREALRSAARRQAEKFSWEKTFARQQRIYEEMVRIGVTRPPRR